MMESILKTINSVKSANYQFTSSCQLLHDLLLDMLIILQKALPDDLTLNGALPIFKGTASMYTLLTKLYFYMYIFISEFVILLLYGIR